MKKSEKMEGPSSDTASNYPDRQFEDQRDPSEIIGKNVQEEITPESKTIHYNSEIKAASTPNKTPGLKSSEKLKVDEGKEKGTPEWILSLKSVIKNLDEEIENLNLGSKTADLESVLVTPKNHFPLVDINTPTGSIPRKLFEKDPENAEKEAKKSEELEIVEKRQKTGLKEIISGSLKRRSSISGLKIPKSWKPKSNLEVGSPLNSSINANTSPTSEIEKQKSPRRILEDLIPYEVEQFLEEVMGDEMYTLFNNGNYDMRDRNNTSLNTSEFLSDDMPKTQQSSPLNSTLNRSRSLYRTMSKRIKKKFLRDRVDKPWDPYTRLTNIRLDDKLQRLCHELNIQQTAIYQASKALDYCHSSEELANSSYPMDLELVIQVAKIRKQAIFDEIKDFFSPRPYTPFSSNAWGEIKIREVYFHFDTRNWMRSQREDLGVQCLFFVVSQGLTVISTKAYIYHTLKDIIPFACNFSSQKLRPDFKINIKVYGLKTEKKITFNRKRREYHIEVEKSNSSPSPQSHEVKFSGIRESSFELIGLIDLQLQDLNYIYPRFFVLPRHRYYAPDEDCWSSPGFCLVSKDSVLKQIVKVELKYTFKFHTNISHSGFLDCGYIMLEESVTWIGRVWCVLEGHTIKSFLNDSEEEKGENPWLTFHLTYEGPDVITSVDRTICLKPRTFIIKGNWSPLETDGVVGYLFHCDTKHDFIEWMTKINHTRLLLREWNVIKEARQPVQRG